MSACPHPIHAERDPDDCEAFIGLLLPDLDAWSADGAARQVTVRCPLCGADVGSATLPQQAAS